MDDEGGGGEGVPDDVVRDGADEGWAVVGGDDIEVAGLVDGLRGDGGGGVAVMVALRGWWGAWVRWVTG
ncbi:MAG: hypothetical protein HOH95_00480 [Dehalococcoidia bacterium]|nr:hypothetical protein [Dehalococcoidia bacterium]